jgi:hypothetical protein
MTVQVAAKVVSGSGTYVAGQVLPLNQDTSGNLLVNVAEGNLNIIGTVATMPMQSAPTSFSATLTTSPQLVLAAGNKSRISFIVQGTGNAAYSFTSATPTVAANGQSTNGYPIGAGGSFDSSKSAVPNTALYMVASAGSTLTVYGDWQ